MSKEKIIKAVIGISTIITIVIIILLIPKNEKNEKPSNYFPIEESTISFVDEEIALIVGEEYELELEYSDIKDKENVKFLSSNPDIISVNEKGIIKALKDGESIISASLNEKKIDITVSAETVIMKDDDPYIEVERIEILTDEINLKSSETYTIKTIVYPLNATNPKIIWETNDTRIATINDEGFVVARTSGTTYLTAYASNGVSASVTVNVQSPPVSLSSIVLSPSTLSLEKGDTYQTKISFIPINADISKVSYTSSNNNIVSVSNSGLITALKEGSATVTARVNGIIDSINVNVIKTNTLIDVYSVKINKNDFSLKVGEAVALKATITPENATNKVVTWTSSNTNIVTVDSNGSVKGKNEGSAVITATSTNGKKSTVNVTVIKDESTSLPSSKDNPTELLLSISSVKLQNKETKQVKVTILPLTASQEVEWVSGSPSIATVSSTGIITGIKSGTTTVSAITKNGLVAKVKVTVIAHEEYKDSKGNACVTPYTCFKQGDYGLGQANFCSTSTCGSIATRGCSVTSWSTILSMFVTDANGDVYTPPRITNEIMYANKLCSKYCSGSTAARKVFNYFGLKTSEVYKTKNSEDRKKLIEHLKEGNPALLRVGAGCYTTGGHLMAILAINDEGLVWLYDPAKNRPGRNTWVSLSEIVSCSGSSSWFMLVGPKTS